MPRRLRVESEGAICGVMNRGNQSNSTPTMASGLPRANER